MEKRAREVLATAQADCGCRIPSPYDEVAEHAIALAVAAERERAAGISEAEAGRLMGKLTGIAWSDVIAKGMSENATKIAQAIRGDSNAD